MQMDLGEFVRAVFTAGQRHGEAQVSLSLPSDVSSVASSARPAPPPSPGMILEGPGFDLLDQWGNYLNYLTLFSVPSAIIRSSGRIPTGSRSPVDPIGLGVPPQHALVLPPPPPPPGLNVTVPMSMYDCLLSMHVKFIESK